MSRLSEEVERMSYPSRGGIGGQAGSTDEIEGVTRKAGVDQDEVGVPLHASAGQPVRQPGGVNGEVLVGRVGQGGGRERGQWGVVSCDSAGAPSSRSDPGGRA